MKSPARLPWVELLCVAVGVAAVVVTGALLLPRGVNLSDEGFLLQEALDMLHGKILYRDIEAFVAPGIWFLVAGLFRVVEPSVLASRIVAAVSYFALAAVCFELVRTQVSGRRGLRYASVCLVVYAELAVWSYPHWTWAWYSPWSILFALLALQALLAWRRDRRAIRLLWLGVCVGLAAVFKQNYGFFALLGCATGIVVVRLEARESVRALVRNVFVDGLRVGAGVLAAIAPLLVYFGLHGALYSIYDRFFLYPLEFTTAANIPYLPFSALFDHAIFEDRVTSTHYLAQLALGSPAGIPLLPGPTTIQALHAVLYWAPPVILALGVVLGFRRRDGRLVLDAPLLATTAVAGFLFLGVFPRADYTHLVTVYQPLIVTGALVWHRAAERLPERKPLWAWLPVAGGVAGLGFYGLAVVAWLAYLVQAVSTPLLQRRGGVLVDKVTAIGVGQLVDLVRDHTRPGEPFFGIPDLAMINFLAERPVPGSQYQTYQHMIARDRGALTTKQLEAANVNFAIARYDNALSTEPRLSTYAPILADYLERNFRATWMIQNDQYLLLERRKTPRAAVETRSVLGACSYAGGTARPSSVRQHLLFAGLFQPLRPEARVEEGETHCRVRIPEGAVLSVQIGYKHPIAMEAGATITAEIAAVPDDGESSESGGSSGSDEPLPLMHVVLPVRPMNDEGVRVPEPRRVDLSQLAGREVTLVFRTRRHGRVRISPFTLETYAMFWQNPVLELRDPGQTIRESLRPQ